MFYEQRFLTSLLLTLIIEIPTVIFFVKKVYKLKKIKIFKIAFSSVIASSLTLPYFWFVFPAYIFNRSLYIFIGEISIIFLEAIIYCQFLELKLSKAVTLSLASNIASLSLGLIIH